MDVGDEKANLHADTMWIGQGHGICVQVALNIVSFAASASTIAMSLSDSLWLLQSDDTVEWTRCCCFLTALCDAPVLFF